MSELCGLLGFSRQAFYKRINPVIPLDEEDALNTGIIFYCRYLRMQENLPKAGFRELYPLCQAYFGDKFTIGRDRFCQLLRANGLMLRRRRFRPRTTDSRHQLRKYPDLLNTEPKFVALKPGELIVADITYIEYKGGFAYLSLLTDAYSRCIVGHCLHPTLETQGPLSALMQGLAFFQKHQISTDKTIHHSDRGCQYASKQYIEILKNNNISISMTQTGDPLHNALAERMNNTLKNSWYISCSKQSLEQAKTAVARAVQMYNQARPHQALGAKTPLEMLHTQATNPLLKPLPQLPQMSPKLKHQANLRQKANFARRQPEDVLKQTSVNPNQS